MAPPSTKLKDIWARTIEVSPDFRDRWGTEFPVDDQGNIDMGALTDLSATMRKRKVPVAPSVAPQETRERPGIIGQIAKPALKAFELGTWPLTQAHERVVKPAVSSLAREFPDMPTWTGGVSDPFAAFRKKEGGVSLPAVADFLGSYTTPQGRIKRALEGPISEFTNLPLARPAPGTEMAENIEQKARLLEAEKGAPVTERERRIIREKEYRMPPFVRGTLEELPYAFVPQAGVMRAGLAATRAAPSLSRLGKAAPIARAALWGGEQALRPVAAAEKLAADVFASPFRLMGAGYRGLKGLTKSAVPEAVEAVPEAVKIYIAFFV